MYPPRPFPVSMGPPIVAPPESLREQVEQAAASRGLLFHPIANRFNDGKQVYRLEQQLVYFDRNVAFCYHTYDTGWHPIAFSELMSKAE